MMRVHRNFLFGISYQQEIPYLHSLTNLSLFLALMNRFLEVLIIVLVNAVALFLVDGCRFGIAGDQLWPANLYSRIMLFFVDMVLFLDIAVMIFYLVLLWQKVRDLFSGNIFK